MREVTIRSLSNELAENRKMLAAQMDAAKVREAALAESRGELDRLRAQVREFRQKCDPREDHVLVTADELAAPRGLPMNQPDPAEIEAIAAEEMRDKWERYAARLNEGDGEGSFFGAAFIIAKSAVTDIPTLLAALASEKAEKDEARRHVHLLAEELKARPQSDLTALQVLASRLAPTAAVVEAAERWAANTVFAANITSGPSVELRDALANYHKATTKEEPNDEDR